MNTEFPYTRLPGTFRGFVRRASLWEGNDHLLSITGTRFSEEYRRFYYRDIEALLIQKCARSGSIGIWLVSALVCLIASMRVASVYRAPVSLAIALAMGAFLLVRLVLSLRYSCRCHVQTAVSREELPSLMRPWITQKALARLRSKIDEAQGSLPDEIGGLREATSPAADPSYAPESATVEAMRSGTEGEPGRPPLAVKLAIASFLLFLLDGAESLWAMNAPARLTSGTLARVFTILVVTGQIVTIIPAIVNLHRSRSLRALRNVLVVSLVFLGVEVWFSLYFQQFYIAEMTALHAHGSFAYAWHRVQLIAGSISLVVGIGGLIFIVLNWDDYRRGTPSAT